jgi:hypothetical protein
MAPFRLVKLYLGLKLNFALDRDDFHLGSAENRVCFLDVFEACGTRLRSEALGDD